MKRRKLLNKVADLLDREGRKKRKHIRELKQLLEELRIKEDELEGRLQTENDKRKRKLLGKQLEIVKAQRAKGAAVVQEIEVS